MSVGALVVEFRPSARSVKVVVGVLSTLVRVEGWSFYRYRTARGLQYSGPVIARRVQFGEQIQFNSIQFNY